MFNLVFIVFKTMENITHLNNRILSKPITKNVYHNCAIINKFIYNYLKSFKRKLKTLKTYLCLKIINLK